jgi:hypothetical protein
VARANYQGQLDFFDPAKFGHDVHIIGVGGIGTNLALHLVKLGLRTTLHLWDPDYIESHNIPTQLIFKPGEVSESKVETAAKFLAEFADSALRIVTHQERVTPETSLEGVVISGVDSMSARQDIWKAVEDNPFVPLYVDGRIGGEQYTLLALNPFEPDAVDYYLRNWMFNDGDASPLPCTGRTAIHPAMILGGHMVAQVSRLCQGLEPTLWINGHAGTGEQNRLTLKQLKENLKKKQLQTKEK